MTNCENIIDVSNLSVTFGRGYQALTVVKNVNFHIKRGEAYGLIGESGCGKSTILNALVGLISCSSGCFIFDGKEVPQKKTKLFYAVFKWFFKTLMRHFIQEKWFILLFLRLFQFII
ncbi:peptide/nickel transport system ATP-binding protein [Bartonella sp. JB15]|nr:peptide/nickel transport system ATP-binding protein [Bartonella sp. JB15]